MGTIDKEAIESMPTAKVAEKFASVVKKSGLKDKEAQKRVARRIVEKDDFSVAGIEIEIFEEKYHMREKAKNKERIRRQELKEHLKHIAKK